MEIIEIDQLEVLYVHLWNKWPSTSDTDYSALLAHRRVSVYTRGDIQIRVTHRNYPIFISHLRAGLPPPQYPEYLRVDNLKPVDPRLLPQMKSDLSEIGKECQVVVWHHAHECYPQVAEILPELFAIRIIWTSDDCPGSSEQKTFPVAKWFNTIMHGMYVWSYATGQLTHEEYHSRGTKWSYFIPPGVTPGLKTAEPDLNVENKAAAIRDERIARRFVYIGGNNAMNPHRYSFLSKLNGLGHEFETRNILHSLYGPGMRDKKIGAEKSLGFPMGEVVKPYYIEATLTVNYPVSSIFNTRLMDCWTMGVVQFIPDRHEELKTMGFYPGQHYILFDGTTDGFFEELDKWCSRPGALADIILAGREAAVSIRQQYTPFPNVYFDHLSEITR